MAGRTHRYAVEIEWTGNTGEGTSRYDGYRRDHLIRSGGKTLEGSSDPAFRGRSEEHTSELQSH